MRQLALVLLLSLSTAVAAADNSWPQLQGDALRSGNSPQVSLPSSLGLVGAVPLTDSIFTSPVVDRGDSDVALSGTPDHWHAKMVHLLSCHVAGCAFLEN